MDHTKGLNGLLNDTCKWNITLPIYPTINDIQQMICSDSVGKIACIQIMPVLDTAPDIYYYENCKANLFAATKRQATAVCLPDHTMMDRLKIFMEDVVLPEWDELLYDFDYSYAVWYNHLTADQQISMDNISDKDLNVRYAKMFCKGEKQPFVDDIPKNRAISALCDEHKYVMGPVVYALESYFKAWKGYAGGCNWEDLGKSYTDWKSKGWTKTFQWDMSGMDRSVTQEIVEIIKHKLYNIVIDKIKHVDVDTFKFHAMTNWTKLVTIFYKDGEKQDIGSLLLSGLVYSGSMDTTLFNTIVTIIVARFIFECLLNLSADEYGLKAKGDDGQTALSPLHDTTMVANQFYKVFYSSKYTKNYFAPLYMTHGLGFTAKYLVVSDDLCDLDFCSTNTYWCGVCNTYRLTRKIDRFIYLTPFTDSIHNLKRDKQLSYLQNLHVANLAWMKKLPIFSYLNDFIKTDNNTTYSLVGKRKKYMELTSDEQTWFDRYYGGSNDTHKLQQMFGKNVAYSAINNVSGHKDCCAVEYKKWLLVKMNLTDDSLRIIESDIRNVSNGIYSSEVLTQALSYYEAYKSSLIYDY